MGKIQSVGPEKTISNYLSAITDTAENAASNLAKDTYMVVKGALPPILTIGGVAISLAGAPQIGIPLTLFGISACGENKLTPIPAGDDDSTWTADDDASEEPADPCDGIDCGDHGECFSNPEGAVICDCDDGYADTGARICEPIVIAGDDDDDDDSVPPVEADPCTDIDCDDHGECYSSGDNVICICEDGYENSGPTNCVPVTPPVIEEPVCTPACVDTATLSSCMPDGTTYITECPEETRCEDGACVPDPSSPDPRCESGMSECVVTDVFDIVEDNDHDICADGLCPLGIFGADYYINHDMCGDDGGYFFRLSPSDQYISFALTIIQDANYYRFDAKINTSCASDVGIMVLFGDDQRYDFYSVPSSPDECQFQNISDFTTEGITSGEVHISLDGRLDTNPADYYTSHCLFGFTKFRIWSCICE